MLGSGTLAANELFFFATKGTIVGYAYLARNCNHNTVSERGTRG
jgi:hypothetical protein